MATSVKKIDVDASYYLNEYHCKISIKGVEFFPQNIEVITIKESIFNIVPTLEMTFKDDGLFLEMYPLEEGDDIVVELSKSDKRSSPISMTFTLETYNVTNLDGDRMRLCEIQLAGLMKLDKMFHPVQTRSFKSKSSVDVLKLLATEAKITTKTKVSTSDMMTWLQINQNNYSFIFDVLERSHRSNDTVLCGITRGREMIITSLKTEVSKTTSIKCFFDPVQAATNNEDPSTKKQIFFNTYEILNIAGVSNKMGAYGIKYGTFDFSDVKYDTVNPNDISLTKFNDKQKSNIKKPSESWGVSILNKRNVHQNYYKAFAQNEYLQRDFFKSALVIYINPTDNVNLFELLDVTFPSFNENSDINEPFSGEYIVGNITHQASKSGVYRMALTLFRSGFNKSSFNENYKSVEVT